MVEEITNHPSLNRLFMSSMANVLNMSTEVWDREIQWTKIELNRLLALRKAGNNSPALNERIKEVCGDLSTLFIETLQMEGEVEWS